MSQKVFSRKLKPLLILLEVLAEHDILKAEEVRNTKDYTNLNNL